MKFKRYIGIDYSGAKTPVARLPGLQVYLASTDAPRRVAPPSSRHRHWNRREVANWLIEQARAAEPFIAGIDHGFSFPQSYLQRYQLTSWPDFLSDFCVYWPTHEAETTVDAIRQITAGGSQRRGDNTEFRWTERWTSSAKSVFQFDVQGSVAKSTHAGIPWLERIRQAVGDRVHFWPFDGWEVSPCKSVIAEVYPSLFRNRYPREARTVDEQDAYSVARWLQETDERAALAYYLQPSLPDAIAAIASQEGWILGVT